VDILKFLRNSSYWQKNFGRDHVIPMHHPNAFRFLWVELPASAASPIDGSGQQVVYPTPYSAQQNPSGPTSAPIKAMGPTAPPGQVTTLPYAFIARTLHNPATGVWNIDTCASSHLNSSVTSLNAIFNTCMYLSISIGDGHSIPVTNTGHTILPSPTKSLHLNNVLITRQIVKNLIFVRDNNCTIEFDAFCFSVKGFMTRRVLL
ncbi:ribonuclease H-like domain-containing protein, partial [Tanacetum coccineum]